jgi:thioredoxin
MELLTKETFKTKVYDYEKGGNKWSFAGDRPAIVDFYAAWCGPCKMVAPVLEQISKEYEGKVDVYKVNTDKEPEIATAFGVSSIPTILFIPKEGEPQVLRGAMPKTAFVDTIKNVFNI